jgi:uncharacterized membrane protein YciS (DUF1049 family)
METNLLITLIGFVIGWMIADIISTRKRNRAYEAEKRANERIKRAHTEQNILTNLRNEKTK